MNQLISNALGIRQDRGDLILDPVMPASMDGLHFDYEFAGTPVTFVYHVTGNSVSRIVMNGASWRQSEWPILTVKAACGFQDSILKR